MFVNRKYILLFFFCHIQAILSDQDWWKHTTIYEIFVWSFKDSNGDGIGDIKGITLMLDHFVDLKIETLWLTPIYVSPMVDFGYDVADFYNIDPRLGTLEDFDELIAETKKRGLKVMMDFVLNHSSDQHPWFLKSINRTEPYTDYYFWQDAKGYDQNGVPIPPNNWLSESGLSAWKWNGKRKQFYYAIFNEHQVDFNFRNTHLKNEIKNIFKFWFDKGVSAARLDATSHLVEDALLRDEEFPKWIIDPSSNVLFYPDTYHKHTFNQPESFEFIHELRELLETQYNPNVDEKRILVVEAYTTWNYTMKYYGTNSYRIAHFPFNFVLIYTTHFLSPRTLDASIKSWLKRMPKDGVANWQIENHDYKRMMNNLNPECMDIMMIVIMTLPGVACIYYGQEIGMTDTRLRPDQLRDFFYRDPGRTPMQWDDSVNAGFSSNSETWLPVNSNYYEINVETEKKKPNSRYNLYKSLSSLRITSVLKYGKFTSYLVSKWIYAYIRSTDSPRDGTIIVIINLGSESNAVHLHNCIRNLPSYLKVVTATMNSGYSIGEKIHTNPKFSRSFIMRPSSAVVVST